MFLEAMVATVCLAGQSGCSNATNAYYQSNKELQRYVKNAENIGKDLIEGNEYIVYAVTPLYAVLSGKPASIKISRNFNLNVNVKQEFVALQWNY